MTTEGEQQEAVCGTCGDRAGHAYHDTDCGCSGTLIGPSVNGYTGPHHEFIQAPVVPSDDERCAFPNSQWGVCGIPESAHADLMEPLAGSRFHHEYQIPAPPTPSQDAEGDGLAELTERLTFGAIWRVREGTHDDGKPIWRTGVFVPREIESAIREPYENEIERLREENRRLRALIERDRTGLAAGLNEVQRIIHGHDWLADENGGAGSYTYEEWNEATIRREVRDLITRADSAATKALRESGDRADAAYREIVGSRSSGARPSQDAEGDGPVCSCGEPAASHCDDEIHARELRLGRECPFTHHPFDDVRRRAYASYDTWEGKGLSRDARESGFIYGYERGRADAVSAIREPYEALVEARGWSARVEYDGQFALVIEWPGEPPYGRYWWVLCPAAATLHDDPPPEDEDPTEHDHGACSLSPECDFNELHALAHQAIRDRAAALESLGGRST